MKSEGKRMVEQAVYVYVRTRRNEERRESRK